MNSQELKETVKALPYLDVLRPESADELLGKAPPAESWPTFANHLKDLILSRDPYEFQRWRIITDTMMGTGNLQGHHLEYLKARRGHWLPLMTDDHPLFHRPTALEHAYYMAQLEDKTGLRVHDLAYVLEFGGGYGNMCYLFHKLGFGGRYVLFDLPVFSALQEFFLSEMGVSAIHVSECKDINVASPSLFIALWSLSEAPHDVRQPFRKLVPGFDSFLITYSTDGVHASMENAGYFQSWENTIEHWRLHFTRSGWCLIGGKHEDV